MLIIAHRGFSALAPENTIISFQKAIRAEADLVEMDLRLSRDREVMVFHDRDLDRNTDGRGPVAGKTLVELKQFDAGIRFSDQFKGQRIPTLAEVLDLFSLTPTGLYLELKLDRGREDERSDLVSQTLRVLADTAFPNRLVLASFDLPAVRLVQKLRPDLETGLIFRDEAVWGEMERGALNGLEVLSARWNIVTVGRVAAARQAGKEVWAWTVDRPEELARVRAAGVDGVATNNPAWLKAELGTVRNFTKE